MPEEQAAFGGERRADGVDTSREAAERLARDVEAGDPPAPEWIAATLRALLAERDAALAQLALPFVIRLGHGMWDCSSIASDSARGIHFRMREVAAPIGEVTAPTGTVIEPDGRTCLIYFDGPELGRTLRELLDDVERMAALDGDVMSQARDPVEIERCGRARAEAERDAALRDLRTMIAARDILARDLAAARAALRDADRALDMIARRDFNCALHQQAMAAAGVAEEASNKIRAALAAQPAAEGERSDG